MRPQLTATLLTCMLCGGFTRVGGTFIPAVTQPDFALHDYTVRYFDRFHNRPSEIGGNDGDMSSLTKTDYDFNYTYTYTTEDSGDPCHPHTTITIKTFKINAHQHTTVFMPNDATQAMKDHEQAHYDINVYAYDQAYAKARTFSEHMLKRQFDGCNIEEAQGKLADCFNNDFRNQYSNWLNGMHQAINDLDGYGHSSGMTPAQAYKRVIAERG